MVGGESMHSPLSKRYLRDLKSNFGRCFSVFIMLTVTIAIMSGFLSVSSGMLKAFKEDRIVSKLEDGLFSSFNKLSEDTILEV